MTTLLEVEQTIREAFEANYEQLRAESGHALSMDVREAALQQVLLYWRKLHELAEKITETEVRLESATKRRQRAGSSGSRESSILCETRPYHHVRHQDPRSRVHRCQQGVSIRSNSTSTHTFGRTSAVKLDETAIISTHVPLHIREMIEGSDPVKREKQ